MNKLWSVLLVCVMALGTQDVWAKRMGGGMSFGKQSGNVTQRNSAPPSQQATPQQAPAQNAAARPATANPAGAAAAAPKRPWGAMLGGLAAGLGLAWLASSLGFGEAFAQFLLFALLGVVVMVVIGMVMRRRAPAMAYQGAGHSQFDPATPRSYQPKNVGNDASARPWERSGPASLDAVRPASGGGFDDRFGAGRQPELGRSRRIRCRGLPQGVQGQLRKPAGRLGPFRHPGAARDDDRRHA
eukprot:TRINITY_DN9884_c0_g1_i4.p3 TRINITY_DN9884_c0_g1~~TRINITY_DN9884_c0_g1_i4.p3  ORF type:complete len:242 (+),score=47.63 TRINITY_DN9884_c0_g1_i4:339-1064(+)